MLAPSAPLDVPQSRAQELTFAPKRVRIMADSIRF